MQHGYKRYFTPDEASSMLPEVIGLIGQIVRRINQAHVVAARTALSDGALMPAVDLDLSTLQLEINQRIQWITDAGVELKLLAPATISFPALRCGQQVHLTWVEGDTTVSRWSVQGDPSEDRLSVDADPISWWEWVH
jgi:hypothetical protein